jgi:nucleoside-triphosphatase
VFFITGVPGIGKTTMLSIVVNTLSEISYKVGGMLSREIRERGKRIGFEILSLGSSGRGVLAHATRKQDQGSANIGSTSKT